MKVLGKLTSILFFWDWGTDLCRRIGEEFELNGPPIAKDANLIDMLFLMFSLLGGELYVQLIHSSSERKETESRFRTKLPSLPLVTFYQFEPCRAYLQSMVKDEESIGNAILILHSDETSINDVLDGFEPINSINYIYGCSKQASTVSRRKIVHGLFRNEHDLFVRLVTDNLNSSLQQSYEQIENHKNRDEARRCLQSAENFHRILKEDQRRDPQSK